MKRSKQEKKRFLAQIISILLVISMIISFVVPFMGFVN